ncbi:MAG: COX15/CtaA family protein [Pseudomonadota bacterium]
MAHKLTMQSNALTQSDPYSAIRTWLYFIAFLVAVMVLVGGATRLTDSGLSITEWAPISGIIPPLTHEAWLIEFDKYKTTTEYQTINKGMSLLEFEIIFWWEWGHRFLGRLIGVAVIVPLIFFWATGRLPDWLKLPLIGMVILGGFQGFIGWWMVKSGLTDRVDVSQIRLAIHLTLACIIFVATVWLARSLAVHTDSERPDLRWQGGLLVLFILFQIFLGGLLAGLDAGLAYNTWPKMDQAWVPGGLFAMDPAWVNFTDNPKMVQFVHRISAYLLWGVAAAHAFAVWRSAPKTTHAHRALLLFGLITLQAMVGIVTLVLQVPFFWALMHQLGGLVLLAFGTAHWHAFAPRNRVLVGESASPYTTSRVNAVHG